MGTLNPGTYEASYYQSQSNKFLGIKTIFVDPDTDPYSWIVTDSLMGFNAMIMNRSDRASQFNEVTLWPSACTLASRVPMTSPGAGCTLTMVSGERMTP